MYRNSSGMEKAFAADGGSRRLWNVGQFLPHYTTQHPSHNSLHFRLCENPNSQFVADNFL
jgi:hypothetical protein